MSTTFIADKANEREAYRDRQDLASVIIPAGVTEIGTWAFERCKGLASVAIPAGVSKIGKGAFSDCISLQDIQTSEKNKRKILAQIRSGAK